MEAPMKLVDWREYEPTESCYLDGRYFNKVLGDYEGTVLEPLRIALANGGQQYNWALADIKITNPQLPQLMRLIISTPETKHSNLLVLDVMNKRLFRFEPYERNKMLYYNQVNQILAVLFPEYELFELATPISEPAVNMDCMKSGYCVAYIIKYALDYLGGNQYDPSDIKRFAQAIQSEYGPLDERNPDIEYGDGSPLLGAGLGGLVGLGIGGAIAGPGGALIGGLGGGVLGYGLGGGFNS